MAIASTLGLACSVVGVRTAQEPGYRVLVDEGAIQVREYDAFLVARTVVDADYDRSGGEGFRRLFDFISGNNRSAREIAMTAPVLQERAAESFPMTAPVLQERSGTAWTMDFVMPAHFTRATVPEPLDERVSIKEVQARTVAVLQYSGRVSEETIEQRTRELEAWLEAQPYRALSAAVSARYDPPFTLPFLRRNEIHVAVEARE